MKEEEQLFQEGPQLENTVWSVGINLSKEKKRVSRLSLMFGKTHDSLHGFTQSMACGVFSRTHKTSWTAASDMTTAAAFAFS